MQLNLTHPQAVVLAYALDLAYEEMPQDYMRHHELLGQIAGQVQRLLDNEVPIAVDGVYR